MADVRPPSMALCFYGLLARGLAGAAPWHLRRRLAGGREDPARWREKLGEPGLARPEGRLVWCHGVGLGEVMALRGVVAAMARVDPSLRFLITSSARSSAEVVAANLPAGAIHQYLPLDAPQFVTRFLDHWRPDLSIWTDQEIWPFAVFEADRRGIPLIFLNARITARSLEKRRFLKRLYADILQRFRLVLAQDQHSADHLGALGARKVEVNASIKAAAPVLVADAKALDQMQNAFKDRRVWVAASTHLEDESVAMAAQARLYASDPRWLLVLTPRDPKRHLAMALPFARRSLNEDSAGRAVYLADSFGELGLWYRLGIAALVGGTFGPVEGHNPWEAAALGCAVLHGPRIGNFTADYTALQGAQAARQIADADGLVAALNDPDIAQMGLRGASLVRRVTPLDDLAKRLLGVMA